MRTLTRRTFVVLGLSGVIAVGLSFAAWAWLRGRPESIVLAVLRRRVGFLGVEEETLGAFASDYLVWRESYRGTLAKLALLAWPLRAVSPYRWLPLGHPLRRLEDNVVSQFLLSTDFFETGGDENRRPRYMGFYDPNARPCRNPFARRPDHG